MIAAWLAVALAADDPGSLRRDLQRYAQREAWAGAEDAFVRLEAALEAPPTPDDCLLGARAAEALGHADDALARFRCAAAVHPDAAEAVDRIRASFAPVRIEGSWRRHPVLVRERMPYAPDQRAAVDHAIARVDERGRFAGLLPAGEYLVGDRSFRVEVAPATEAGGCAPADPGCAAPLVIDVRRPGDDGALPLDEATRRGAGFAEPDRGTLWAGPVVAAGPALLWSPDQGGEPRTVEPTTLLAPAARVHLAAELGLAPALAVAPGVAWQGGGSAHDAAHQVSAELALVLRPDPARIARIALAPTYGVLVQQGYGVTGTLDRDDDADPRTNAALPYRGLAWGPGARLAVGAVLPGDRAVRWLIEVVGAWQGGPRDVVGGGVQVGVAPAGFTR